MSIATEVKDEILTLFAGRVLTVGLFDGITEIKDVRYERLPVQFGEPQTQLNEKGEETDVRFVENVNELRFLDMGKDHRIDAFGLFDEAGELRAMFTLVEPRDLPADDNAVFRAGSLKIGMP